MTTSYAQAVYARARQDVAETGFIRARTEIALLNLGLSAASVAGLERDYRDGYPYSHRELPHAS